MVKASRINIRNLALTSLFSAIIFIEKIIVPAPYDKFVSLFVQAALLMLGYLIMGLVGSFYISILSGILLAFIRNEFALMTLSLSVAYGVSLGLSAKILRVKSEVSIKSKRPNTILAKQIGCELGVTRAIKVNPRMQTTVSGVYAAGDCVESQNMITGLPCLMQLGTFAVRLGKVAGTNAAGGYSTFPGVIGTAMTKIFNFEIGAAGLTEKQAQDVGFKTVSGTMMGTTRAEYFPGKRNVRVKIVAEPYTGKIMGAQIVGGEGVAHRVNMLSIAIQNEMSVRQLMNADTGYAPPMADTWEPIVLAAELTARKIRRWK